GAFGCSAGEPTEGETGAETETKSRSSQAVVLSCGEVPAEYVDDDEGCDCPADGTTSCDPDCVESNGGEGYCGCDYCYPEEPPWGTGGEWAMVPGEYVDVSDGCDSPAEGDTSCDADCDDGNGGDAYCGCDYCYPEEPPGGGSSSEQCAMVPAEYLGVN